MQTFDEATELSKNFLAARETVESMQEAACNFSVCGGICNCNIYPNSDVTGWVYLELQAMG
ncbi:MAG: hypothetical protein FWG48_01935 [Oscillospiraceae bacterium]|nr:hypothetical protein [Oscillospiraceae bacterium]